MEDQGFTNLLDILKPRYAIRNCNYFSDEALPELYSQVYNHTQKLLSNAVFFSFMADIWSSSVVTLQPAQWAIMEEMISALEPFEEIIRYISCGQATAADTVPAVASLKRLLALEDGADQGVKAVKRMLLAAVGDRFKDFQTEPLYVIATMVDAHLKDSFFW